MDPRKSKKVKSILGYLQDDVPGAPVDATLMDDPAPDEELPGSYPMPPEYADEDELLRKKRRGASAPDAFAAALSSQKPSRSY